MELSKRLRVKPLKPGQVKIFQLVGNGTIDPATKKAAYNAGGIFTGYFTIFDKYEDDPYKRKKILKNVTGSTTKVKDGKEEIVEIVSNIEFSRKGLRIVKHNEYTTLVCLMRANENKSNPFRDSSVPAVWEELDPAQGMIKIINDMDIAYAAETLAVKADMTALTAIAKALNESDNGISIVIKGKNSSDVRFDMRRIAREHPKEFMKASKEKEWKIKLMIEDAIKLLILSFDDDSKEWKWDEEDTVVLAVKAGEEPVATLVEHLLKTKEDMKKLEEAVSDLVESRVEI